MRSLVQLTSVTLLAVACSGTVAGTISTSAPATTTASSTATSTVQTTTTVPQTTTTSDPGPPLGLVTPTGVPVAISEITEAGFVVHTPCGRLAEVADGKLLHGTRVVIDPGHGGAIDTGGVGRNGLPEKEVNLAVAEQTLRFLTERGFATVLTRTGDYASTLTARARLADSLRAELMVSIHHNAPTPGPSPVPGIEVFVQSGSAESARIGGLLWAHTMTALSAFDIPWTAADDAGVITVVNSRGIDAYGIIRTPDTPTALVELGYISNPPEAELFSTAVYARVAGRAVGKAIEEYLTTGSPGSGFGEGRVFNPSPGLGRSVCEDPALS